jgi:tungstate transport system permease protein
MGTIIDAFREALLLVVRFDPEFYRVLGLSLVVSGSAAVIGACLGIPLGACLAEFDFRGRKGVLSLVHAFMGLPPVVVGLFTFLVLARSGPLGSFNLIYTPTAMIIVQAILATPIVAGFTHASMQGVDRRLGLQARSLGATRIQAILVEMREARAGLVAAVIAGLGRVLAEVGAVMIVGGNIKGSTRVLTTDIVLQTRQGNYELALAEGLVLILIAIVINVLLTRLQAERGREEIMKRTTGYPT